MDKRNATMHKSLLEMSNRAVLEKVDRAYSEVLENIKDPNTEAQKKREIIIKMTVIADSNRGNPTIDTSVTTKLCPSSSIRMNLYDTQVKDEETGEVKYAQAVAGDAIAGQINLDGTVHMPDLYVPLPDGKKN